MTEQIPSTIHHYALGHEATQGIFTEDHNSGDVLNVQEQREKYLDSVLDADPNRPLPHITLTKKTNEKLNITFDDITEEEVVSSDIETERFSVLDSEGRDVGYLVTSYNHASKESFIGDVKIHERGKGYGPATYLSVLKSLPLGSELTTRGSLSDDATRIWEDLVAKGLAKRIDENNQTSGYTTILNEIDLAH